jgi:hypothetical protein
MRLAAAVLWRHSLAIWFVIVDQVFVGAYFVAGIAKLGSDAVLYATAAGAWRQGGDPWQVAVSGVRFAAPPPTLLLYVPFVDVQANITAAFWVGADLIAIVYIIRRLRIPWWWAMFPPVVEAIFAGNPEPVMLALLVSGSVVLRACAPVVKIYAFAPLVGERDWPALTLACVGLVLTALILPWGLFINDAPLVATTLTSQAMGLSALSVGWLLPAAVAGLLVLGLRRAGWLAVPVVWPHTQLHYALIALPKMTPVLAFGLSVPVPGAPAVALVAQVILERMRAPKVGGG